MKSPQISKSTLDFLKRLSKNNNREWFNNHKQTFLDAQQNMADFADALIVEMNKHDELESTSGKKSLFRIYKDVRFSKDKLPYNSRFAFNLQRASKSHRGGYYLHIAPGKSYLAVGFFGPNPEDLKRIREDISHNYKDWNKIINSKQIKTNFGGIKGEAVLTAPKGYSKDHPAIELLRHKQFIFSHHFKDNEVLSDKFLPQVNSLFKSIRPYFNYMSEVLTTDLNGESLL